MARLAIVFAALLGVFAIAQAASLGDNVVYSDSDSFGAHSYAIRLTLRRHSAQTRKFKNCAAVAISKQWFVTAAECFDNPQHKYISLTAPDHFDYKDKRYELEKGQVTNINNILIKIHPEYNQTTRANNIALVQSDFYSSFKSPKSVALPYLKDGKTSYVQQEANVYTYDFDKFHSYRSLTVLKAKVVEPHFCNSNFPADLSHDKYFCANVTALTKVISQDDVGAPLVFQATPITTEKLLGIVTSPIHYPTPGKTKTVQFTKIYGYLKWINSVTGIKIRSDAEDV